MNDNLAKAFDKAAAAIPKGLVFSTTEQLKQDKSYFHVGIYGDTGMRKTTTAASFGNPTSTLIILTRRKEQLIPIRDLNLPFFEIQTGEALIWALANTDKLWQKAREEREKERAINPDLPSLVEKFETLVVDDVTEGVNLLLDENQTIDGREVKDRRRTYSAAGADLREALKIVLARPHHTVIVAMAKVRDNQITHEETIYPDLPPSMLSLLIGELEFVFYVRDNHKFLTDRDSITFKEEGVVDGKVKEVIVRRNIFAKSKFPLSAIKDGIKPLAKEEEMNLRTIWDKVCAASASGKATAAVKSNTTVKK